MKRLLSVLVLVACSGSGAVVAAEEDISEVYPTTAERAVLGWSNVARMDYAKMPTPRDDTQTPHPDWEPPAGGEHDCPPVAYNRDLGEAARFHAQDMADKDYFAHESDDGTTFDKRIARFGYGGAVGENIAMGQPSAKDVVQGWMMSPGHRQNMLLCVYEQSLDWMELGTGYARPADDPVGYRYWVQDFGAGGGTDDFFLPALPAGIGYRLNNRQAYFGVNFYDPLNEPPTAIRLVRDGECHELELESGKAAMGTYSILVSPPGDLDLPFYFQVIDSGGFASYYPEDGSLVMRTAPASKDTVETRPLPACAVEADPEITGEGEGEGGGEGEGEGEADGDGDGDDGGGRGRDRDDGCAMAATGASPAWPGGLLAILGLLAGRRRSGP